MLDIDQHQHVLAVGESKFGNSPLQLAILSSNEELSKQIAQRWTADEINHRNFKGETALHMATINGMSKFSTKQVIFFRSDIYGLFSRRYFDIT